MQSVILEAVVPFAQHTLVSHAHTRALHKQLVNADRLSAPAPPTSSQRLLKLPFYFWFFFFFTWLIEVKSLTLPCAAIKNCDFSSLNHSGHQGYWHWLKQLSGASGEFVLCRMSCNSFGHNGALNPQYVLWSGPKSSNQTRRFSSFSITLQLKWKHILLFYFKYFRFLLIILDMYFLKN